MSVTLLSFTGVCCCRESSNSCLQSNQVSYSFYYYYLCYYYYETLLFNIDVVIESVLGPGSLIVGSFWHWH